MAKASKALSENADGNYFVDSTCINCGVSRHYAPEIFGNTGVYAYVKKQPRGEKEEVCAQRALLACPMASIGMKEKRSLSSVRNDFPIEMAQNIFLNGFNHRNSFGAHSYFIRSEEGNWLVDSPRYIPHLVRKFEEMGGIRYIFLTHKDDVCDAHKFARHFGAARIIHKYDSGAQKDAELILSGGDRFTIGSAEIHYMPGHTKGHMVLLWNQTFLFTGDHYAWIKKLNQFASFRNACWYSWSKQIESVRKMQEFKNVQWVFPGHGKWGRVKKSQFPEIVKKSVQWMLSENTV